MKDNFQITIELPAVPALEASDGFTVTTEEIGLQLIAAGVFMTRQQPRHLQDGDEYNIGMAGSPNLLVAKIVGTAAQRVREQLAAQVAKRKARSAAAKKGNAKRRKKA